MLLKSDPRRTGSGSGFALWQLGFRPFFLLAGWSAVLLMIQWLLIYFGHIDSPYFANPVFWHSHELLFGYVVAVVAGFLLTAVQNWTGQKTQTGTPLLLLAVLWLAGRLAIASDDLLPAVIVLCIDVAFLPVLAMVIAVPLLRVRQYPNLLIFISLLTLMTLANLLTHLHHDVTEPLSGSGIQLMLFLVMVLIAIMAGRVVPFFTERGLGNIKLRQYPWLERLAVATLISYALAELLQLHATASLWLAGLACVTNALRWWSWHHPALWRVPMLWVLHLAYVWLVLSLLAGVLAHLHWTPSVVGIHAFTVGSLGMITLGMMTRVSQGHSGRNIAATSLTTLAFVCLLVAALIRVFGGIFGGSGYSVSIVASAAFWLVAFGLFEIEYMPILIKPRIDGRPG